MTDTEQAKANIKKLGLTQKEFATKIGLSHQTVRNGLNSNKKPPTWVKLLNYLMDKK